MKMTGLVVDDDDSTRFVLSAALKNLGFEVVIADDGADVPDLITARHFDLLVMDLYMPGMNGFEVLRWLRHPSTGLLPESRTPSDVNVLVVSGESHPASVANAKALGANEYMVKPVDLDQFERVVHRLLSSKQLSSGAGPKHATRTRKPASMRP